jgi:hypothetical protein
VRTYREGDRLAYRMKASNRDRVRTTRYEATARGVVKRDANGALYEEYEWADIVWDGAAFSIPEANRDFRQTLSLAPNRVPAPPDFSKVHPRLVGPVADLLTFYADVWLAARMPTLRRAGDRVRVPRPAANSWADGSRVILGEDSIDFDVTLGEASPATGVRELTVAHVPPERPAIRLPAEWMRAPVADVANNWVEVARISGGRYIAAVGKETFEAHIQLSVEDGRVISATLHNPVDVRERECEDEGLTRCGEAVRYQILREIEIASVP